MKSKNIIYYIAALFIPVILFVGIMHNGNERYPYAVFLFTIPLFAAAGYLSVPGKVISNGKTGGKIKWMAWSAFIGLVESLLLVFAV